MLYFTASKKLPPFGGAGKAAGFDGEGCSSFILLLGLDGLDDLVGDVLVAGDGGVAIQLSLSKGDGNVGGTVNIGQLLFVVVQLAEVVAPAGQQGHGGWWHR